MFRVQFRTHPLRWSAITALAATVVLVGSVDMADAAKFRRKHRGPAYSPPYAAMVVDAQSGEVLHAANADAPRHPASLTKIMTLYMLFEQIEAGKLKLDSELEVSAHAASQAPTKLGLRPGQTLEVDDAIKALVTKSANDAAVVVAEAIGGTEDNFARMMTRKARALGMTKTTYMNASGLPNPDQITTARDQVRLGRAIQDRFPRFYHYFATHTFRYRGRAMRNHNHLLGRVEGVDGIKTGYTRASGFNLVSSVRRGHRHIVAAVIGGSSRFSRDARMRSLIETHIAQASTRRTVAKIAEGPELAASRSVVLPDREPDTAPEIVANARQRIHKPAEMAEQIHPLPVRTIRVKPGAFKQAEVVSLPSRVVAKVREAGDEAEEKTSANAKASAGQQNVVVAKAGNLAGGLPLADQVASVQPRKGEWVIQIGAFDAEDQAKRQLQSVKSLAKTVLASADPFTERVTKGDRAFYRARFAGLNKEGAEAACKYLKKNDVACLAMKN